MHIDSRQTRTISGAELSKTLKGIGFAILDLKKKNIPHETIAKKVDMMYHATLYLAHMVPPGRYYPNYIEELLDAFYESHPYTKNGKFSRSLMKQFPENNLLERESTFLDNMLIKDLSKYLKNNNLSSKIEGCGEGKMILALKVNEKDQIANFLSAWLTQFEYPSVIQFWLEDLNARSLRVPPPDRFNPKIKKEKITPMFL